ncbi:hypothetical protein PEPS_35480 (plasmid) [Persicobacter psychrovividus]|uniref:Right handed beta helix domain-containing protein n=2 Tax=Persicobacter psychrovividus TaxID=387638 RepID=A0ABN6LDI4_9BACT|nr:hypothetical protein PEPS_35480 [Persicobacter psychrovividus]
MVGFILNLQTMLHLNKKLGVATLLLFLCLGCKIKPNLSLYSDHPEILTDYYQVSSNGMQLPVFYGRPGGLILGQIEDQNTEFIIDYQAEIHSFETIPEGSVSQIDIDGQQASFQVDRPVNFFIRINGNYVYPLMVSVSKPEKVQPTTNMITFEAGIHDAGVITLKDNQTLFLKKGAYVNGTILVDGVENVKICGEGILTGKSYKEGSHPAGIFLNHCQNIEITGISIIDAPACAVVINSAEKVYLNNLKILGNREQRMGDDAFNIFNAQHITINNVMANTRNNSVALMNNSGQANEDITVKNATFWKGDYGNVIEIGYKAENMFLKNCTFKHITIAHIDAGSIINITGKNNIIEDLSYVDFQTFDCRFMLYNVKLDSLSKVKNVHFEQLNYSGLVPAYSDFIFGTAENAKAFWFNHLQYKGLKVKNMSDLNVKSTDYIPKINALLP